MDVFDNIVLIHKKNGKFLSEGYSVKIYSYHESIKGFYEENGKIIFTLSLEKELSDEKFDYIIENFCYEEIESLGCICDPIEEYYPTFIIEFNYDEKSKVEDKINDILRLFYDNTYKNLL